MLGSTLDRDQIEAQAAEGSFERGIDYHEAKAVLSVVDRGDGLRARVTGSRTRPYAVVLEPEGDTFEAACSCPDDRDGWCKHVVAVLLAIRAGDDELEARPTLEMELDELGATELRTLVEGLAGSRPEVLDLVEAHWETVKVLEDPKQRELGPGPFRRGVLGLLHGGRAGTGHTYARAIRTQEGIEELLALTDRLTREGAPKAALRALEAMTEVYLEGWEKIHGLGRFPGEIVESLAEAITQAIEQAHLSESEVDRWSSRLEDFRAEVDGFRLADEFLAAKHALRTQEHARTG